MQTTPQTVNHDYPNDTLGAKAAALHAEREGMFGTAIQLWKHAGYYAKNHRRRKKMFDRARRLEKVEMRKSLTQKNNPKPSKPTPT